MAMAVDWTEHRFAGGALALDVANSVVLRADPSRRFDRFDDPAELARFAEAATRFRCEELDGARIRVADGAAAKPVMIELRESTDRLFRAAAGSGKLDDSLLPPFLRACAAGLEAGGNSLQAATARSALALLDREQRQRIRTCDNCGWLFVDRSRNGSRRWCDMAVCGNRRKARRHYARRRTDDGRSETA